MKKLLIICIAGTFTISCHETNNNLLEGKLEREQIGIVSKIPGKILEIKTSEGAFAHKGDTLAILDIPEVDAKKSQVEGIVQSAKAQYQMARNGATSNQMKQLEAKERALKEQYEFAQKSIDRLSNMLKDSLVSQQKYDEAFAKYQGAQAQYLAVQAEIADVKNGVRIEQQQMALGQQAQALGALEEVSVANAERYVIAPQDMNIESITLNVGELTLAGYTLISGTIANSSYFRFTLPEKKLDKIQKDKEVTVHVRYNDAKIKGKITAVKALNSYAKITTAYPDYEFQESLFEIRVSPLNLEDTKDLFNKTTVTLAL